jgi:predicted Zn-dependent protease
MVIARVAAVVAALVVCAWFAVGIRQAVNTNRATALVGGGTRLTGPEVRRARSALDAAGSLNPDLGVELLRGQLAFDQHRWVAAERIFMSVTRREPMNLQAWTALAYAAAGAHDERTGELAGRRISALYANPK